MKTPLLILLLLFFLLFSNSVTHAWDSTAAKFYPLAVGNLWSYRHINFAQFTCVPYTYYDYTVSIVSDTLMPNGKRYYRFSSGYRDRIDSATMNVYRYVGGGPGEILLDSLLARKDDYFYGYRLGSDPYRVIDTALVNFACQTWRSKSHLRQTIGVFSYRLASGLGLIKTIACEGGGYTDTLNGCIINGIQYGQILGTPVIQISNQIPNNFFLYQNFPNPFNPNTKIKFDIASYIPPLKGARGMIVRLNIFDILGREVVMLVNESLKPGTYEVDFDGTNYPSGVYYYRLKAGEYLETRKMVLIK
ncbi:MAG: T9SS type A sorting domain-containing protein [Ignavibacteria bacterium]